ncbi:MAG TPA: VWA domain-containing protein [Candidatus Acidoferrales bacterium]
MRLRCPLLLAVLSLVAAVTLTGQNIPEDEIRVGSRPYVPTAPNTVRVKSNLVEVPVVVRDDHGKIISGLQKDSFEVEDRGKKQTISFFSVETAPRATAPMASEANPAQPDGTVPPVATTAARPRYVAFYFDDFNMPEGDLTYARIAAEKFVRESMQAGDKAGIFTTSTSESVTTFTDDKQRLLATLAALRTHQKRPENRNSCAKIGPYQAYLIMQFWNTHSDALDLALAECHCISSSNTRNQSTPKCVNDIRTQAQETLALSEQYSQNTLGIIGDVVVYLAKMPGRRMLLLTSSGFLTQTLGPQQEKVIKAALRGEVVINSLDARGLYAELPGGELSEGPPTVVPGNFMAYRDQLMSTQNKVFADPLAAMADETGGRFFHNNNDLGEGMREIASVPEISYVLGFEPDNVKADGGFHDLKVKLVSAHGLSVEARRGYFAPAPPTKAEIDSAEKLERLDRQVLGTESVTDVPAELSTQSAEVASGGSELKVMVHVDVHGLPFKTQKERRVERLIFVTALFDTENRFLVGVQQVMDLSLKDATLAQLSSTGLTANLSMQPPPGTYRLREVVQETGSGHIAALNKTVEIH